MAGELTPVTPVFPGARTDSGVPRCDFRWAESARKLRTVKFTARIGSRIGFGWQKEEGGGRRKREEGERRREGPEAQSHRIYSVYSLEHRIWLIEGGGRRETMEG